jgi:hypothetical protein
MGLWTLLVVGVVLGGLSLLQQRWELANDLAARDAFLASMLAPLVDNLEAAAELSQVRSLLRDFRRASQQHGQTDFELALEDGQGQIVGPTPRHWEEEHPRARLHARIPLYTEVLAEGHGALTVWLDDARFRATAERRQRRFGTNLLLVLASILASLLLAEHFLVTRPLRGLLKAARLAGRGHFGELEHVAARGRAPEWRALAAQLLSQGRELEDTVRRLMQAERRGSAESTPAALPLPVEPQAQATERSLRRELVRRFLVERCRTLEAADPQQAETRRLAAEVWSRDVAEAERLGDMELRRRLDDAAFRVLEPEAFRRVSDFLRARAEGCEAWLQAQAGFIREALAAFSGVEVLSRVKHAASVRRKMQAQDLPLEALSDVFGFRVLVSSQEECYRALAALHAAFSPEPLRFKDYIAAPKSNGYQSLHTSVRAADGQLFEIQIRTPEMHRRAELGSAAHWQYKLDQAEGAPAPDGLWRRLRARLARGPATGLNDSRRG